MSESSAKRKLKRFIIWLLFTAVFAVFPLLSVAGVIRAKGHHPTMEEILGSGEVIAICCALAAAGIGDVLSSNRKTLTRVVSAWVCVVVLAATIVWYSFVGFEIHMKEPYDTELVVRGSVCLYIFAVITAGFCVGLSED